MNSTVQIRINEKTQQEAAIVLAEMGLTISDIFSMLLTRIACEKILPFELLTPNEQTLAAIEAARKGNLITIDSIDNLLNELNAQD